MTSKVIIQEAQEKELEAILEIYNFYILTTPPPSTWVK
jgi:hypothetical protein